MLRGTHSRAAKAVYAPLAIALLGDLTSCSHLKSGRLEVAARLARFADHGGDRACALEDGIAGALVGLPLCDKAAQAVVEELLVDNDVVSHGCERRARGPSAAGRWVRWGGGEKATGDDGRRRRPSTCLIDQRDRVSRQAKAAAASVLPRAEDPPLTSISTFRLGVVEALTDSRRLAWDAGSRPLLSS